MWVCDESHIRYLLGSLGFINNYKESQLWLVLLRYSADVVSAFPWIVTSHLSLNSHCHQPTSTLNSHPPTPLTHATINPACLPSSDPPLTLTQLTNLSPKPTHAVIYPTHADSVLLSHLRPYRCLCVSFFLCCCWIYFAVIQKILNFLKFCLWLVIFDGLGWGKRLGIWVGVMQPFCLVTKKIKDILIIWLLIEIGFFWVKWY